ncbi:MAG: rplI [Dehalococcoidia bacterium]|nr:rplI [Dehalococcoidia bacterium]
MRVIFLEDVPNVASTGEVKEVKAGYACNYLLPKRLAVAATPQEMERIASIRRAGQERRLKEEQGMKALAERLESTGVTLKVRAGPNGKLYGAVTNVMIAQELSILIEGEVDRRNVLLEEPLHELGTHQVTVRLHPQITATVTVTVEPL